MRFPNTNEILVFDTARERIQIWTARESIAAVQAGRNVSWSIFGAVPRISAVMFLFQILNLRPRSFYSRLPQIENPPSPGNISMVASYSKPGKESNKIQVDYKSAYSEYHLINFQKYNVM